MEGPKRPYKHLLWIRILLGIMAVTNITTILITMPMFTHQEINYNEFLDIHQLALNIVVLIACISALCSCCYRFPSWIRLLSGCVLLGANLAYPIIIFFKITRHNVGYGQGCNGYNRDKDGNETTFLKTRCYVQYIIGSLNIIIGVLVAAEVGLSWRMSRDEEYLEMVEKERQEMELKETQRRERAMMVHHYQPNLTLDHQDDIHQSPRESLGDVLPEYQQRETAVGLGRLVDMGHIVNGEAEEICPHPYIEEGEQVGGRGYMDPSPFSAEDIEAQARQPMSPLVAGEEEGSGARLGVTGEGRMGESEAAGLSTIVVVPVSQPPSYEP
jgi:hypothetical protein